MQTTSVSLLERLANSGDDADWQRLLTIYRPFIEKVVKGYPVLATQADDIAQEVAMVLMRELPVFQRQRNGSFRNWLRLVTVNRLRIALRNVKREPQASPDWFVSSERIESLADPTSSAAHNWDEEHDRAVMERIVDIVKPTVQEQSWQAFQRYAIDDEPPSKVAEELGMTLNAVLLAKSRILRRLRDEAKGLVED